MHVASFDQTWQVGAVVTLTQMTVGVVIVGVDSECCDSSWSRC